MKYSLRRGLVRNIKTKVLNMSASLVLAAMSLGGSLPIFAMGTAHAIGSATVVQPYSLQGWNSSTTGSGQVQFIQDKTAPSGKNAALQLTTAGNNEDRASLYLPTHTPLKSVSQLSYETRQISASFAGGDPAYRLTIDADGNPSTANDTATLVYEPYWQDPAHAGDPAPVVAGQWQSWDVASGVFWASIPGGNSVPGLDNGAGGPPFYTLSQLQSTLPNAEITEVSVGVGSYNLNYNTEVSDLNFDGNSYDFTTPPTPAQSSQVVYPSDLQLPFSSPDVWYYYDDNATSPFTAPTTTGSPSYFDIVANPVPQNGDNGAVVLNASNGGRPAIATTRYSGTKLSDISSMGFSTYQPSSNQGPANESSFLNFDVNFGTGLSGYQGRLVYVPSTNGTVKQNQWQNWETVASNGRWTWSHYYSNGSKWPDGSTSQYRSWDDIIAAFPNAQISGGYIPVGPSGINVPGQLLVRAGNPDNYTFVGYTDHIYLSTYQNDSNVNYNFELPAPATPTGLHFTQKGQTLANNVTNDGADNLQLRWSPVPNATGYALAWTAPDGKNSGGANPLRSVDLSNPYFSIVNTALHSSLLSHGNGVYTFEIYAIDNGVRSTTPATISLIYDTQAPTVAFTSPSGSYLNTTKPFTISGTYTEHGVSGISRIQLYISKGDKYSYGTHLGYWTATLLTKPIPPADDATGTFSYSVTQAEVNEFSSKLGIANGDKFTITAVPIDNAGNGQNSRFNLTLTADSTQPAITVTKPTSNSNPSITVYASNRWAPLQISGTATNIPANMMVKVTDIQNHGNTTEYLNDQVYTDKNGNWSVSVPAGKLTNGDLMQVIVFGRDRYGATATAYAYFTVDDTPPIVQLLAGTPADKSYITGHQLTVNFAASDNTQLASAFVGVKENGTWINGCRYDNLTVAKITESCPVNLPANADGTYVVTVYAFDSAGNESDWQQRTITVDNTPPVVAITAPASGDTLRGTVTVSGTVTDVNPGHYYFVVKNSTGTVVAGPGVVHKPQVASWQWDTTKVADGTYTIDLEARDAANNKGAASTQTISVTVDNTAPTAAITSPTIDQVITGTSLAITGTATDSNFGYYTYVVEDNKQVPLAPAVTVNTPVVAGQLGTWDISSLNNGSYYAVLTVFDKAGNQSSVTQHFTINNNQGGQGGAGGNGGQGGLQGGTGGQGGQADFLTPHVLGASINTSNGQVLGDSTTTPNNTTGTSGSTSGNGDSGNVKGDSINLTNNSNNKSANGKNSNFLGLGWWWLPILAVIIVFFLIVFRRSNSNENQKA